MAEQKNPDIPSTFVAKSGLLVSRICFGLMSVGSGDDRNGALWAWTQSKDVVKPLIKRALEAGINFFDTANVYSEGESERIFGEVLRELNVHREDVVIATKFSAGRANTSPNRIGRGRKHIFACCEESLKRLGTDYIDLYIVHTWKNDTHTSIEETMEALNDLVRSGKVRYIGTSNMTGWQLVKANQIAERRGWAKFISVQNLYSLLYREDEREIIPACVDSGVGYTPWSPLHGGYLCGRKKGEKADTLRAKTIESILPAFIPKDNDWPVVDRVNELAAKKRIPPAQVALAWNLAKPYVTSAIIGVTKPSHLEDAIGAIKVQLTEEDIKYLEEPYKAIFKHPFGHW